MPPRDRENSRQGETRDAKEPRRETILRDSRETQRALRELPRDPRDRDRDTREPRDSQKLKHPEPEDQQWGDAWPAPQKPPPRTRSVPAPRPAREEAPSPEVPVQRHRVPVRLGKPTPQQPAQPVFRPDSPPIATAMAVPLDPVQLAERALQLASAEDDDLVPCQYCNRKFNANAHAKHVNVCIKVFQKKRKVFNSTEHRLPDAPELVDVRKAAALNARKGEVGLPTKPEDAPKKTAWRLKSAAFRAAMKNAQLVTKFQKEGRPLSELPSVPTPAELDDRTQCPHCGRKFGAEQAKRHIPVCNAKNSKSRPPAPSGKAAALAPTGKAATATATATGRQQRR